MEGLPIALPAVQDAGVNVMPPALTPVSILMACLLGYEAPVNVTPPALSPVVIIMGPSLLGLERTARENSGLSPCSGRACRSYAPVEEPDAKGLGGPGTAGPRAPGTRLG